MITFYATSRSCNASHLQLQTTTGVPQRNKRVQARGKSSIHFRDRDFPLQHVSNNLDRETNVPRRWSSPVDKALLFPRREVIPIRSFKHISAIELTAPAIKDEIRKNGITHSPREILRFMPAGRSARRQWDPKLAPVFLCSESCAVEITSSKSSNSFSPLVIRCFCRLRNLSFLVSYGEIY